MISNYDQYLLELLIVIPDHNYDQSWNNPVLHIGTDITQTESIGIEFIGTEFVGTEFIETELVWDWIIWTEFLGLN